MRGEHPSLPKGFTFPERAAKALLTNIRSLFRPKARERFVVGTRGVKRTKAEGVAAYLG